MVQATRQGTRPPANTTTGEWTGQLANGLGNQPTLDLKDDLSLHQLAKVFLLISKVGSELLDITFADMHPYPALTQATYLLNRVSDHIRNCDIGSQTQKEATFLDRTLQAFSSSLLRQAEGQGLYGNYCTAFFTSMMFVFIIVKAPSAGFSF
jgi:hypothetical protein